MRFIRGAVAPISVLVIWEFMVRAGQWPSAIIASPTDTITACIRLVASGKIFEHVLASLFHLGVGFFVGTAAGVILGSLVGMSRLSAEFLAPIIRFLAPIPVIAWIPLLIIVFGIDGSGVALITCGCLVLVYSATVASIQDSDPTMIEVGKCYEKSRMELYFDVILPGAAWDIVSGCRVAAGLSWVLLLASELIASSRGLGWLIWDSRNFSRPDEMLAGMVFVGVLGYVTDSAIAWFQELVSEWRPTFHGL